jgi:hypothetical protein
LQRARQIAHIEDVLPEPANVLARVGAGAGDQSRVGDETGVFEPLSCSTGLSLFTTGPSSKPSRGSRRSFDLGGFGADGAPDFGAGGKAKQEKRALDSPEFVEGTIRRLRRLYVPSFQSSINGMTCPAWIDSATWILSRACVAIRSQSISPLKQSRA